MKAAVALSLIGLLAMPAMAVTSPSNIRWEDYGFLSVADDWCIPKVGEELAPEREAECRRMTGPHRYRGTWIIAFETSIFKPPGKPTCIKGVTLDYCPDLVLEGKALPSAGGRSCAQMYEVDFIGRRSVHPGSDLNYRVVVDRLVSMKRLPNPAWGKNCAAAAR